MLMLMSLLQLHDAIFSIATPDLTECILEVFFLGTLGFLGTPRRVRFAGTSSGSVNVSSALSVISLSVPDTNGWNNPKESNDHFQPMEECHLE